MHVDWGKVLPVAISIGVILLVAVLRNSSRTVAAIAATMPINIPLTIWIVAGSGVEQTPDALVQFMEGLLVGLIPTMVFVIAAYLAARLGWSLVGVIATGYVGWGVTLFVTLSVQAVLRR